MGQKVNPTSLRLKINRSWDSTWYAGKQNYASAVVEDYKIRKYLINKFEDCGVSKVEIGRNSGRTNITIFTSKPGLIIGRQGTQVEVLREDLTKKYGETNVEIREIKSPDLDATIVADSIAKQIERRVAFRRAAKQAITKAMQSGAKGIKVRLAGRLNGVEIARVETFKEGNIPLHTLRSKIDYADLRSNTIYGVIGVKVWIYKGESFKRKKQEEAK